MEGRVFAAQHSPLFGLPTELIDKIISFIEFDKSASLACLALVNSDCLQISRICRFRDLELRMDQRSADLFRFLLHEAAQREIYNGLTLKPSLGVCVRQVLVSNSFSVRSWPDICSDPVPDDKWGTASRALNSRDPGKYFSGLPLIIPALPYLDKLSLGHGSYYAGPSLTQVLEAVAATSIRHLVAVPSVGPALSDFALGPNHVLPLTRLDLQCWNIALSCTASDLHRVTSLLETILKSCSTTLEVLSLQLRPNDINLVTYADSQNAPLSLPHVIFPRLRYLRVQAQTVIDETTLRNLLCSPLRALNLDITQFQTRKALCAHRHIPSLEYLLLTDFKHDETEEYSQPLEFVKSNPQLKAFEIKAAQPDCNLGPLLKVLADANMTALASLALSWKLPQIPDKSLHLVASLTSLENLYLSAGYPFGRIMNWALDHDNLSTSLSPLKRLERLVLSRDTYPVPLIVNPDDYYPDFMGPFDIADVLEAEGLGAAVRAGKEARNVWEEMHQSRMVDKVTLYGTRLPCLRWMYIGQRSFRIERHAKDLTRGTANGTEDITSVPVSRTRYMVTNTWLVSDSIFERAFSHKLY